MGEPREKAAPLIDRHDLLALRVIDADERMVGIVTVDAAMDGARATSLAPPPHADRGRGDGAETGYARARGESRQRARRIA
ncbi:MAG: hypothetical protein HYZ20_06940 [Burkholderiales bacterium]|nr:hypothetical protein [Burkholderiales bacterium]